MRRQMITSEEFLAVRHSVLNGNTYDVEKLVDDTLSLEKHMKRRRVVPCFEGDVLQVRETEEVILTHQNFSQLSQDKYRDLKARKLAASLEEVIEKVATYKQKDDDQKIVLCFEPKSITSEAIIYETIRLLKEYGIEDAYFDSFFGEKLDAVVNANQEHETDYARSLHLVGNFCKGKFMMRKPKRGYDFMTIPHAMSLGVVGEPLIYGAVGSTKILEKIAAKPYVQGAYVRFKEGSGLKGVLVKLWNSVTNTEKLRQTQIVEYSIT